MTDKAKENLIYKLREKGMDNSEILEIINYVEKDEPTENGKTQ